LNKFPLTTYNKPTSHYFQLCIKYILLTLWIGHIRSLIEEMISTMDKEFYRTLSTFFFFFFCCMSIYWSKRIGIIFNKATLSNETLRFRLHNAIDVDSWTRKRERRKKKAIDYSPIDRHTYIHIRNHQHRSVLLRKEKKKENIEWEKNIFFSRLTFRNHSCHLLLNFSFSLFI